MTAATALRWLDDDAKMILLAPVLYAAHVAEEAPGFVGWFNSVVTPGLSQGAFIPANVPPLIVTTLLAAVAARTRRRDASLALLAWIAYYMFANSIFHLTATVVLARHCPGTLTAPALYLPYFCWFVYYLRTQLHIHATLLTAITGL